MIVQFNNQGIAFIEKGCYAQALIMFQGALQLIVNNEKTKETPHNIDPMQMTNHPHVQAAIVTMLLDNNSKHQEEFSSVPSPSSPPSFSTYVKDIDAFNVMSRFKNNFSPAPRSRNHGHCDQQENVAITMFTNPIKIDPSLSTSTHGINPISDGHSNAYACIILYNRALATHLEAMEIPPSTYQESKLHSASKLYEMAIDLIPENTEVMNLRFSTIITLAALNNVCYIHHSLGEYDVALHHVYDLEASLEWLRDYVGTVGLQNMWRKVYFNTLVLLKTPIAASVA